MGECYVCTEMAYTLSPCKCTNLFLHENCYAKLLAYDNTKCGVCTEPFPLPKIDPIVNITIEPPALRKLSLIWFFFPILSRPHPFIYMEKCMNIDIVLDVIRNMIGLYFISSLISLIMQSNLNNGSIWVYGFVLYIALCLVIRQTFAFK